ncbi:MAG: hypothetical protein N2317_01605 [Syntrophales bacterium]|nr:hypothetical protein [Syntrophales bacterium]
MVEKFNLNKWIEEEDFTFAKLHIEGIDNEYVFSINEPEMREQEICIFHKHIKNGEDYLNRIHLLTAEAITIRKSLPIVRFADGEYAFYNMSMKCNGLYRQAESKRHIQKALPYHVSAFRKLAAKGILAPLIFPGNINEDKRIFPFLVIKKASSSLNFLEFLHKNGIRITKQNYIPFYVVYAWLTSPYFAELVNGKNVCIVNSDNNPHYCENWFKRFKSYPNLSFVEIPANYVATRWPQISNSIISQIPDNTDLCLVGAGIGALLVCVDVSEKLSIPTVDAGHVLNMINGREDKSNGPRLYTLWKIH